MAYLQGFVKGPFFIGNSPFSIWLVSAKIHQVYSENKIEDRVITLHWHFGRKSDVELLFFSLFKFCYIVKYLLVLSPFPCSRQWLISRSVLPALSSCIWWPLKPQVFNHLIWKLFNPYSRVKLNYFFKWKAVHMTQHKFAQIHVWFELTPSVESMLLFRTPLAGL